MADEVDIEQPDALRAYLRATGKITANESVTVRVLAGGVSNKTVLVQRPSGEAWVLKQALPKLRVKVDWFSDPARIGREALALHWLPRLAPKGTITPLVFEDPARHLLAMVAVPQPHDNWKSMLMAGRIDLRHVEQFGRLLGMMHARSSAMDEGQAGGTAGEISGVFADRSFFQSLRIEPYYRYTASVVPESAEFYSYLITMATSGSGFALVHGDYSPKNILVRHDRLVLLDHEVIHWGDPAFDLGFATAHLLSKAHHLRPYRAHFKLAALTFASAYIDALAAPVGATPVGATPVGATPVGATPVWAVVLHRLWVDHTLGCLLARVAGRSPLEYLTDEERGRQGDVVLRLMKSPPDTVDDLVLAFGKQIGA